MAQFQRGFSPLPQPAPTAPTQPPPQTAPPPTAPTAPSGGGFYVGCGIPPGSPYGIYTSPFAGAYGPFATQAEAQTFLQTSCPGGSTTPAPPTAPLPPTGTGPAGIGWYAVCLPGGTISVVPGTSAAQALTIAGGSGSVIGGPWPDDTIANQQIAAQGLKCGVKEECSLTPIVPCPQIPATLTGLGTPGTPEWCKAIDLIVTSLGDVGNQLFKFIDDLLNTKTRLENIDEYISTTSDNVIVVNIVRLIRQVFCFMGPFIETIRQGITCLRQWLSTLFPKCNASALFGLSIVRLVLITLERIEWGSDAAIWVVAASGLSINPLTLTVEYLISYACPAELADESATIEAYKYNNIDEATAKCILRAHGKQWETAYPGIIARGDKPGWREAMQYVRRLNGKPDDELATLRNLGVIDPSYRQVLQTVYDELPTISDHLHWLQRNVFDDAYVKDFDLMNGFEDRFWAKFGHDLRALGMKKEYAGLHYAAHWINPSFTQLFAMVQRNRAGRVAPGLEFSRSDFLRVLAEMDVAPYFRERLESISHSIPNLTLVLQMYQFGQVDDAEFVEKLKDLSYTASDATTILDAQRVKVRRLNASSGHGWTPAAMAPAYAVGKLAADQIYAEMSYLGYSRDDADRLMRRAEIELTIAPIRRIQQSTIRSALTVQSNAYKCGAISAEQLTGAYTNAGIPQRIGQIAAASVDSAVAVEICNSQIKAFKRALLTGKVNLDQIRGIMNGVGIPQLRVEQYLKSWVIEAQLKAPQATAAQILRWVGQGLLDQDTAAQRLRNLGWEDPDLTLQLAESLAKLARMQQALTRQAAKSQQTAAKAALQAATEAERTARQLRQQLRGIAPMGTLRKWYKLGLINDAEFLDYAHARGYTDPEAETYLAEAMLEKNPPPKPPKPKPPPTVTSNGNPAPPA